MPSRPAIARSTASGSASAPAAAQFPMCTCTTDRSSPVSSSLPSPAAAADTVAAGHARKPWAPPSRATARRSRMIRVAAPGASGARPPPTAAVGWCTAHAGGCRARRGGPSLPPSPASKTGCAHRGGGDRRGASASSSAHGGKASSDVVPHCHGGRDRDAASGGPCSLAAFQLDTRPRRRPPKTFVAAAPPLPLPLPRRQRLAEQLVRRWPRRQPPQPVTTPASAAPRPAWSRRPRRRRQRPPDVRR
ncbi:hypothetical protein BU14_0608s0011 [Porphyra umbilicalis]|uniref:Uncharacterized protein n=1 Tax=Porphyra umbilicalis TaxID=2786 RepID=A0A1X6NRD6_PORUM|nr:hypothetical protein BU14_0608s0011 [Porphyra umbilicalis]|eukprot:OSX71066.1 hypothetical protein BU14_0608s0011 [Porphyra umbilicalis]